MAGKVCVITGATSGIGLAAAEKLAGMGASLALVGRDSTRGEAALERLRAIAPEGDFRLYLADLTRIAEMKRLAADLEAGEPRIDVLINNAGAFFGQREVTEDGLEKTFALNHMAPFVVTNLLRHPLMESVPARIVTTASAAHKSGKIDFGDLQFARQWRAIQAYSASKLANILFTTELARRLEGTGITANAFHPGVVSSRFGTDVRGPARLFGLVIRAVGISTEKGAETMVYLASSDDVAGTSGAYFVKCAPATPAPQARDADAARRLWEESARLAAMEAFLAV